MRAGFIMCKLDRNIKRNKEETPKNIVSHKWLKKSPKKNLYINIMLHFFKKLTDYRILYHSTLNDYERKI